MALAGANACGAERTVLLEKLSITWCPHCMSAARDLDDLVEDYGDRFVPLEIFSTTAAGGRYTIPWGQARTFDYYRLSGYPTTWFDGVLSRGGSVDAYNQYLNRVNSRLTVPTDILVGVTASRTGERTYDVTASVSLEATGVAKIVRVYLVEALDGFGVYDDNQTVPRNTLKQVVETGFDVALTPGQTQRITRTVAFDSNSWNQFEDIRLIAWAQTPAATGPAEIHNVGQLSLADTIAGDFDGNGVVNRADLGVWRTAFGKTSVADANGDGVSDGADLLAWQRTLGNTGPASVGSSTAIPEPAGVVLIANAVGVVAHWRRRGRTPGLRRRRRITAC